MKPCFGDGCQDEEQCSLRRKGACADIRRRGTTKTMPKFHLILAAQASTSALIRRGPKKWSCVFGWDWATDTFPPGQCLKGYLDAAHATLSPCGKYFVYAVNLTSPVTGLKCP